MKKTLWEIKVNDLMDGVAIVDTKISKPEQLDGVLNYVRKKYR